MTSVRYVSSWLFLAFALAAPVFGKGTTQVTLLLDADAAKPGDHVTAALQLRMAPRWHTYWKNPGDSGMATKIQWKLPPGVESGEIQWPPPEKITEADLTTYAYHGTVLLLIPLTLSDSLSPGTTLTLEGKVSWLECEKQCLPGNGTVQAQLQIARERIVSAAAPLIAQARARLPALDQNLPIQAVWDGPPPSESDTRPVLIEWAGRARNFDFFPEAAETFEVGSATERLRATQIRKQIKKLEGDWPKQIAGVLVDAEAPAREPAFQVALSLQPPGVDDLAAPAASAPAVPPKAPQNTAPLPLMLLFAFLGGLILNVMPCVLPIISLKILGFVRQSHDEPARIRRLGLVFGLGVLVSMLAMALLVIGIQSTQKAVTWGMQFQNPQFLVVLTILVTLVSLNLFGLFEINLGGRTMAAAGTLVSKEGMPGAFFNGMLATVLATPCTAPYLGSALGFAFAQPWPVVLIFFLVIGVGLALPYVVLSFAPNLLRFVPKPGPWMENFKIAMGFPMLATGCWLFWLTTLHFGETAVLWLGLFLVCLAAAVWIWGQFVQRRLRYAWIARAISALILIAAYAGILEGQLHWRNKPVFAETQSAGAPPHNPAGIPWRPWSPEAVAQARDAGRPVLVDFTARYCFTCKVNQKTSLEIAPVREKLAQINAETLIADFTLESPRIAAELGKFQRAGVPLVLVYPADRTQPPIVLPELLTPGIVLDALNRAAATEKQARR